MDTEDRVLAMMQTRGVLRPRDLAASGISRDVLYRLEANGDVERIGRGLYVLRDAPLSDEQTMIEAVAATPGAIVCLLTALRHHDLTEANPTAIWLGLKRGRRRPVRDYPPIEVVWMSGAALVHGVVHVDIGGTRVRMTSPERSVADAYKFRGRIGGEVALFALRRYLETRSGGLDALWEAAEVCRVTRVITAHVQALT